MRFYLDEDLSGTIAPLARSRGLDVTSSHELGRDGYPDEEQPALAAGEGRCVVTKNGRDFRSLSLAFEAHGWPHAGVLVLPRSRKGAEFGVIVARLAEWAERYPEGLPPYFFAYL
ncbi:MAG TPA: DUF5615 family PIN-like protein [Dehalococcoidia bacterium]|jgi:hypothetical protein|nr:DUF5615 family PIN-like protein [Dehalococcoidia bacterium]